jgi:hypothetical protein
MGRSRGTRGKEDNCTLTLGMKLSCLEPNWWSCAWRNVELCLG